MTPDVMHYHYDIVDPLPPGAVLLMSSHGYPNQAWRIGPAAWGLQFHIEPDAAVDARVGDVTRTVEPVGRLGPALDDAEEVMGQVWRDFAHRFVAFAANPEPTSGAGAGCGCRPMNRPAARADDPLRIVRQTAITEDLAISGLSDPTDPGHRDRCWLRSAAPRGPELTVTTLARVLDRGRPAAGAADHDRDTYRAGPAGPVAGGARRIRGAR